MGDNDHGYKLLFSDPAMVRDLLLGFVREDWIGRVNLDSLERVSGSYVSDDLRERHDDVVWRVRFADDWLYVYVLLEFQSTVDKFMALRILTYVALLYQDLVRAKQLGPSGLLPPVLPIVLYNGDDPWRAAKNVSQLVVDVPGQLGRYRPRIEYLLIDEGAFEDAELESAQNLVAALFRLEKSRSPKALGDVLAGLFEWLQTPQNAQLRRSFAVFLNRAYFGNKKEVAEAIASARNPEELRNMLAKNLENWEREFEARCRADERRAVAARMLARKLDVAAIMEMTGLSEEEIEALRDRN